MLSQVQPLRSNDSLLPHDQKLRLFVLQRHSPQSHTYVGQLQHTVNEPAQEDVGSLTETVRSHIKSLPEFKPWGKDVDDIDFAVHQVRQQHTSGIESLDCRFV